MAWSIDLSAPLSADRMSGTLSVPAYAAPYAGEGACRRRHRRLPGISNDGVANTAQIDSSGHSYSAQALAAAGATPGSTVNADGLAYTWPDVAVGQPDGVLVDRQTVRSATPP